MNRSINLHEVCIIRKAIDCRCRSPRCFFFWNGVHYPFSAILYIVLIEAHFPYSFHLHRTSCTQTPQLFPHQHVRHCCARYFQPWASYFRHAEPRSPYPPHLRATCLAPSPQREGQSPPETSASSPGTGSRSQAARHKGLFGKSEVYLYSRELGAWVIAAWETHSMQRTQNRTST